MKPLTQTLSRMLVLALVAVGFAACDSTPSAVDESADGTFAVQRLTTALDTELQLSTVQLGEVRQVAERHGDRDARDPGYLWYLAGELNQTLSQEQIQAMLAQAAEISAQMRQQGMAGPFGPYPEGFGSFGFHGRRPGLGELGAGPGFGQGPDGAPLRLVLTDEQWEALKALRLETMDDIRALCDAVRSAPDEAAREAAVADLEAALSDLQAAIDAWLSDNLTDEQQNTIQTLQQEREARRLANREAVRAAIEEVLGPGIADGLQTIHDAFVAAVEAARESEEFDRGSEAFRQAILAAAADRDAAIEALLDEEQFQIYRIHQALLIRAYNLGGFGPGHQYRNHDAAGIQQGDCVQDCDGIPDQTQQQDQTQQGQMGGSGGMGGYGGGGNHGG